MKHISVEGRKESMQYVPPDGFLYPKQVAKRLGLTKSRLSDLAREYCDYCKRFGYATELRMDDRGTFLWPESEMRRVSAFALSAKKIRNK